MSVRCAPFVRCFLTELFWVLKIEASLAQCFLLVTAIFKSCVIISQGPSCSHSRKKECAVNFIVFIFGSPDPSLAHFDKLHTAYFVCRYLFPGGVLMNVNAKCFWQGVIHASNGE